MITDANKFSPEPDGDQPRGGRMTAEDEKKWRERKAERSRT
jgi:hypothetical protein